MDGKEDVRIKQCIRPTAEELRTIYHELGHVYYFLWYKDQPFIFQNGAHDGFHEAVGDTINLSMTPEYLAQIGHCMDCHSKPGPQGGPDLDNGLGARGMPFNGPWGTSLASNITPRGVGHYTDAQLKTVITTGVRPDGSRLRPPMGTAYYARMTAPDLDALVAYLRTLPPK
jgi:hypothetical protein